MRPVLPPLVATLLLVACAPPAAPTVTLGPPGARTADDLVVQVTPPRDDDVVALRWFADGVAAPAWDDATTVPADATAKGQVWRVEATYTRGARSSAAGIAEITIANTAPTLTLTLGPDAPTTADDLVATPTLTDPDGDAGQIIWTWRRDGKLTPYTEPVLPADATARGQVWEVTGAPIDADEGEPVRASVTIVDAPPLIARVDTAPSPPRTGVEIEPVVLVIDPDGDPIDVRARWTLDGVVLADAATLPADALQRDQVLQLDVEATAGGLDAVPASTGPLRVGNGLPRWDHADLTPEAPDRRTGARCEPAGWSDPDEDAAGTVFAWTVDGAVVPTATDATLPGAAFSRGQTLACTAIAFDGFDQGAATPSDAVVAVNALPTVEAVALNTLTPRADEPLTATLAGLDDPDGDPVTSEITWLVNGIPVATGATIDPEAYTAGDLVQASARLDDGFGLGAPFASALAVVVNARPDVTAVRVVTSPVQDGAPVVAEADVRDIDGDPFAVRWSWTVDGIDVPGVTGPVLDDAWFVRGQQIVATARGADAGGEGLPGSSAPMPVVNAPPVAESVHVAPEPPREADVVTCVAEGASDPDGDPIVWTWQWTVDGVDLGVLPSIDGSAFDRGAQVVCAGTPSDGLESGPLLTSAPTTAANSPPTFTSATLLPTDGTAASTFSVDVQGLTDLDGDSPSFTVTWFVNNLALATGPTLDGGLLQQGDYLIAEIRTDDGIDVGPRIRTNVVQLGNAPPSVTAALTPSPLTRATRPTLTVDASDADDEPLTITASWQVNGVEVQRGADLTLPVGFIRRGDTVSASLDVTDGTYVITQSFGPSTVINAPPTAPGIALSSLWPTAGKDALTCRLSSPATDADNDVLTYQVSWARDGLPWTGPTTTTTLPNDTIPATSLGDGEVWTCTFTPSDPLEAGATATATATSVRKDLRSLAAGNGWTCGILEDDSLRCWGAGGRGMSAVPPGTARRVVSAGTGACRLGPSGTPQCWNVTPQLAAPPTGAFADLAASFNHACGLRADGTLACWGLGISGSTAPPSAAFTDVAVGYDFSCGIRRADATLACWGANTAGQATPPAGTYTDVAALGGFACAVATDGAVACWGDVPAAPPVDADYVSVSTGYLHACAVRRSTGEAACWGDPNLVFAPPAGEAFLSVSAGFEHTCGLRQDGTTSCWGTFRSGADVLPTLDLVTVAPGRSHTCAIDDVGFVTCWGDDTYGKATPPPTLPPALDVDVGLDHSCALTATDVVCWGRTTDGRSSPPALTDPVALAVGGDFSCALQLDGAIVCWGRNANGRATAPLGSWEALDAGLHHACALDVNGEATCWGMDTSGEILLTGTALSELALGAYHSCALTSVGGVHCVGNDSLGQVSGRPVLTGWQGITAGEKTTCVWGIGATACWGSALSGAADLPTGVAPPGNPAPALPWVELRGGGETTCGITAAGVDRCVGRFIR